MAPTLPARRLSAMFRRNPVLDMDALEQALPGRSRRSLYRDLSGLGYLASYSHAGRYYTLRERAPFDEEGLWIHQGIGFSIHGTLKETSCHLVEEAEGGRTHRELAEQLHVRVHNTLLALVEECRIRRESVGPTYLYVSADAIRAATQVENRRRSVEAAALSSKGLPDMVVVEVLLEVIHDAAAWTSPKVVSRRLQAKGMAVSAEQVEGIYREHGIVKKGRHSRSRRSPR